jgi:hypothetical protein
MPVPSHHVNLALFADDMTITDTSSKTALLISCLKSYLRDPERWLREWTIANIVSKSTTMHFAKVGR